MLRQAAVLGSWYGPSAGQWPITLAIAWLAVAAAGCGEDTTLTAPSATSSKADGAPASGETTASPDAVARTADSGSEEDGSGTDAVAAQDTAPEDLAVAEVPPDDIAVAPDTGDDDAATVPDQAADPDGSIDVATSTDAATDAATDASIDALADANAAADADAASEVSVEVVNDAPTETAQDTASEVAAEVVSDVPDVPPGTCLVDANCDDKNQCTDDKCQPDGTCLWNLKKGPCEDGNPCTVGDACDFLQCKPGALGDASKLCGDGNACTTDACDAKGGCVHTNATSACDDGSPCTVGEKCAGGACKVPVVGGSVCDDGKPCTTDSCDPKNGNCMWVAVVGACEDGNLCTTGEVCKANQCIAGATTICQDNNECTDQACDAKTGKCAAPAKPGADAIACDGTLTSGRCVKAFKATVAFTAAEVACVGWGGHLVHIKSAEDNTQIRGIANAVCGTGAQALIGLNDLQVEGKYTWTDGSPVTYTNWGGGQPDNCVGCCSLEGQGEDIVHVLDNGHWNDLCSATALPCYVCDRPVPSVPCNDSAKCISGGVCVAGSCAPAGGGKPTCEDSNPCTADSCLSAGNCTFTAVADGTACGTGGKCSKGLCSPGADASNPAASCAALAAATPGLKATTAWIDPDGKAGAKVAAQTQCDPATTGAAWTLLAVVSDDAQATFTWAAKDTMWGASEAAAGSVKALNKDFRSPLLGSMPITDVYFVHASGAYAQYPLGKGTQSLGQAIAAAGGPTCYPMTGAGIAMTAGTIAAGGKLCDTKLYLNADDHDGSTNSCNGDNDPEPSWGPTWNVNRESGCFDDPGWAASLGPVKSEPATEGGTAQPQAIGFGWALGLNKGTNGSATNWMRVYGR